MKRIIFGAMAAAALLACSKEQVIEQNRANDEISFNIVADNQTRANAVYCANNLLPEFNVAATYTKTGATAAQWYFQNDNIKKVSGSWVNQTTTRYWADNGTLDFYAIYNGDMNLTDVATAPALPTVDFTPADKVADQKDLLYAVATGKKKSDNAPVALNFRHALSQIEFRAKNTNAQLYVVIEGVQVGHTPSTGIFTYPAAATSVNYENHEQNTSTPVLNTGSWALKTATADYTASFDPVIVAGNKTNPVTVGLTLSNDFNNVTNSMLLLPTSSLEGGKTTAWTPAASETDFDGTYLAVNCKIYNVAGASYAESDICLHEGWAVMPVEFAWEPGKKYIYTFIFGEGNGGYDGGDPDPDPDPENPDPDPKPSDDPVLAPISYTVTVDDFQLGVDSDVTMEFDN
jgi:hypothetical protein